MHPDPQISRRRAGGWIPLLVILAAAALARLWFLTAGTPYAVGIDEPQVLDRALRILRTGDWNPHLFDYPTLVIYLHAGVAILRFLWGAVQGEWSSLDGFSVAAIYQASRFAAAAIGVATVWLVYRLGRELSSRPVALLAAAQLAVRPIHVRESHFALTDVPATALATLAIWLTARAGRLSTVSAYAWAGAVCGLAAAAKYNGGIVIAAPLAAWIIHERTTPDRLPKIGAIIGGAALGFVAGAPYTILDMPAFLDGFAAQFSRFAAPVRAGEPGWITYVKHLSPTWAWLSIPLALAGAAVVLARRETRARWIPLLCFAGLYFYVLSTHTPIFGRYALPLIPPICLLSSVLIVEIMTRVARMMPIARPGAAVAAWSVVLGLLLGPPVAATVRWLDQLKRPDTRGIAADWLVANAPAGSRIAVENSGPTYLTNAGFKVVGTELLLDHPADWYRARADYLILSSADLSRYDAYTGAGPVVFQIGPTLQRWGPPIVIVQIAP